MRYVRVSVRLSVRVFERGWIMIVRRNGPIGELQDMSSFNHQKYSKPTQIATTSILRTPC